MERQKTLTSPLPKRFMVENQRHLTTRDCPRPEVGGGLRGTDDDAWVGDLETGAVASLLLLILRSSQPASPKQKPAKTVRLCDGRWGSSGRDKA